MCRSMISLLKGAWTLERVGAAINISLLTERRAASEFIHACDKSLRHEKSAYDRTDFNSASLLYLTTGWRTIGAQDCAN